MAHVRKIKQSNLQSEMNRKFTGIVEKQFEKFVRRFGFVRPKLADLSLFEVWIPKAP